MPSIETIGIPVRSVNWVRVFPTLDAEGRDCLVAVMGQQAAGFTIVKIDPVTGGTSQVTASDPTANFPTSALRSRDGRIYVGAAYAGHLYRYDPASEQLDDVGAVNLPADTFPCNMDEDPDGVVWIGCYGSAGLTSYDPSTGEFVRHGRMDETDMYCYPHVGSGGTIACLIRVTRPHVVVYEPESGVRKTVGPWWLRRTVDPCRCTGRPMGNSTSSQPKEAFVWMDSKSCPWNASRTRRRPRLCPMGPRRISRTGQRRCTTSWP